MADLRFGRSETNIRMVRTFAIFFGSGQYYMYYIVLMCDGLYNYFFFKLDKCESYRFQKAIKEANYHLHTH